jgi:hypothetical protein
MRTSLLLASIPFALSLSALACGGNVNVGTGGTGGGGTSGTGATAGTGATSTTSSISTTTTSDTIPPPDFYSCTGPGQCTLALPGCCEPCGVPQASDYTGVNLMETDAYHKYVCPMPTPCPGCVGGLNPNLFAYCSAGKCTPADITTNEVSECAVDSDCHLRAGTGCCEACGNIDTTQVVAVSSKAPQPFESLVCAPMMGCPGCIPSFPANLSAVCNMGHCAVKAGGLGGP